MPSGMSPMTEYVRNNIIIEFFAKLFPHILLNGKFYLPLHSLNRGNKSGEVVEWSITAVLKTVELRGSGGSNPSLSANDREVGWVANDIRLQPFCFSEATNLFGAFRDRP